MLDIDVFLVDGRPVNVDLAFVLSARDAINFPAMVILENALGVRTLFHSVLVVGLEFGIIGFQDFER